MGEFRADEFEADEFRVLLWRVSDERVVTAVTQNYRDLIAWQKAMDLVELVYAATTKFPSDERFGLTSQVRRAVVSVPSNIAEGQGRRSQSEFVHFRSVAHGSLREVETQMLIAMRLRYLDVARGDELLSVSDEVGRLIAGLARSIEQSAKGGRGSASSAPNSSAGML